MKFSLQTLVLITLIAALAVNYFILAAKTNRSLENQQKLSMELEISRRHFNVWRGDQGEFLEAGRKFQQDLISAHSNLLSAFERFSAEEGELEVEESMFSIKQIPHFPESNKFKREFNIFVPSAMQLAAQIKFEPNPTGPGLNRFVDASDASIALPAGKSVLTFLFERCDGHQDGSFENAISLLHDGEIKRTWLVKGNSNWFGCAASNALPRKQKNLAEVDKLKVISRFSPSNSDRSLEFSIVDLGEPN